MRVVARGWGSCALVRARVLAWSVLGPRWWRVWVCARVVALVFACVCVGWFDARAVCPRVGVCPRCCVPSRVRVCVGVCGGAALVCAAPLVVCCGGFLLSRTPWGAVPLARPGLASRFGMLLGVSPVL